jgi:hypothetical protein
VFARKIVKPQTKAAERPTSRLAPQRSALEGHRLVYDPVVQRSIGNRATPRLLTQQALRAEQEVAAENKATLRQRRGLAWDLSKIPVFPPDRASQSQPSLPPPAAPLPGTIQAKLAVGSANDPLEHEADRVADQVMRMFDPRLRAGAAPQAVNRKCAACEDEEQGLLQTKPARVTASEAHPIVGDVLRSAGQPMDRATHAFFEPRFRFDFRNVRIHADSQAARSASAMGALAYTVGRDVVFAASRYAPHTEAGRSLLAHELAHVVQQSNLPLAGGRRPPSLEAGQGQVSLQRQPDAGAATAPKKDDWAGKTIPEDEKRGLATGLFQDIGVTPVSSFGSVAGAKFLLHDTSGASSRAHFESEAKKARGPLGSGPNVFVPASGLEIIQRPEFYDPHRPTTTEREKGEDLLVQTGREAALRKVWKATDPVVQQQALDDALAGLPLSTKATDEKKTAESQLKASSGTILSTGNWAVAQICQREKSAGAKAIAAKGKDVDLTAGCKIIGPVLEARTQRAASTVSVELVQEGVKSGARNQNTCDPANPDLLPLPDPPYSNDQYWNTVLMYVRAAIAAGVWPVITTHFVEDAFTTGHCDPRCFDLQRLYDEIAGLVGHTKGSTYGVKPTYGTRSGTDTVWWDNRICHRGPP